MLIPDLLSSKPPCWTFFLVEEQRDEASKAWAGVKASVRFPAGAGPCPKPITPEYITTLTIYTLLEGVNNNNFQNFNKKSNFYSFKW